MAQQQSHYTVLARRFRPQTFDEVVGQEHAARALRNAIRGGRVAHAYLFTGARGVGKTSMARILAKALNCPNAEDAVPCNTCDICDGISAGTDLDVLEIDGASNRGIDDIRTLRSNVTVKSMRTKYKLYIIDEVHMLTNEAFNALLKTLEEPPANVKFVFCTTEPNKVPDTILSRCQRFDFASIATASIAQRLSQIAECEKVQVEPEALELVARRAAGSMRDSQSLFDQLLAFAGETIGAADLHQLFGTASDTRLVEILTALVGRECHNVLQQLDEALGEGVQLGELVNQLVLALRDLMILAAGTDAVPLLSVSAANRSRFAELAAHWGLQTVLAAMQILADTQMRMQRSTSGRALLESALVRISMLEDLTQLETLIRQFRAEEQGDSQAGTSSGRKASTTSNATARSTAGTEESGRPPAAKQKPEKKSPELTDPTAASGEPALPSAEFAQGREPELWAQVVAKIDDLLKSHLNCVSGVAISGPNRLELTFPRGYHFSKQYCERPEVRRRLEVVVSGIAGRSIQLNLSVADDPGSSPIPAALAEASARRRVPEEIQDGYVQEAMTLFKATVAKVEPLPAPAKNDEGNEG